MHACIQQFNRYRWLRQKAWGPREEPRFSSQVRQQYILISSPQLSHRLWGTPGFLCNWYRRLFPRGWRRTWSLPLACIKSRETLPPLTHTPPWQAKWSQHRDFTFTLPSGVTAIQRTQQTTRTDYDCTGCERDGTASTEARRHTIFIWNFFPCLTRSIISALCNRAISIPTIRFDGTSTSSAQHFYEIRGSLD